VSAVARLTAFVVGSPGRLSRDAERGRKEALWIAAAVWLGPVMTVLQNLLVWRDDPVTLDIGDPIINLLIFGALVRGRPWARKFTMVMLAVGGVLHLVRPFVLDSGPQRTFADIVTGFAYGAVVLVLWRSPYIRAYFESQDGQVRVPRTLPTIRGKPG
jgi:hypothetical protein